VKNPGGDLRKRGKGKKKPSLKGTDHVAGKKGSKGGRAKGRLQGKNKAVGHKAQKEKKKGKKRGSRWGGKAPRTETGDRKEAEKKKNTMPKNLKIKEKEKTGKRMPGGKGKEQKR